MNERKFVEFTVDYPKIALIASECTARAIAAETNGHPGFGPCVVLPLRALKFRGGIKEFEVFDYNPFARGKKPSAMAGILTGLVTAEYVHKMYCAAIFAIRMTDSDLAFGKVVAMNALPTDEYSVAAVAEINAFASMAGEAMTRTLTELAPHIVADFGANEVCGTEAISLLRDYTNSLMLTYSVEGLHNHVSETLFPTVSAVRC